MHIDAKKIPGNTEMILMPIYKKKCEKYYTLSLTIFFFICYPVVPGMSGFGL